MAITIVAFPHLVDDGGLGEAVLFSGFGIGGRAIRMLGLSTIRGGDGLAEATVATDLGGRVEEDLDFGVREDGGSYIAAFHDDSTGRTQCPLLKDHPGAKVGVNRYLRGGGGDVCLPDAARNVCSI
jgi:hypothetical protein